MPTLFASARPSRTGSPRDPTTGFTSSVARVKVHPVPNAHDEVHGRSVDVPRQADPDRRVRAPWRAGAPGAVCREPRGALPSDAGSLASPGVPAPAASATPAAAPWAAEATAARAAVDALARPSPTEFVLTGCAAVALCALVFGLVAIGMAGQGGDTWLTPSRALLAAVAECERAPAREQQMQCKQQLVARTRALGGQATHMAER